MNLKNGDILLCTGRNFIPKVIMYLTKSKVSHAAIYFEVEGIPGVIEAQANGVNWKPYAVWKNKWKYEYEVYRKRYFLQGAFKKREDSIKELSQRALSVCGETGYDFVSFIIRHPLNILFKRSKYNGYDKERKYMVCSEYVGWVYELNKWWLMTPQDLLEALQEDNSFKKVTK